MTAHINANPGDFSPTVIYGADNEGKWDGYMFSTNGSTPFYHFANGSYLNYQGYFDYQFAANKIADQALYSNNAIE